MDKDRFMDDDIEKGPLEGVEGTPNGGETETPQPVATTLLPIDSFSFSRDRCIAIKRELERKTKEGLPATDPTVQLLQKELGEQETKRESYLKQAEEAGYFDSLNEKLAEYEKLLMAGAAPDPLLMRGINRDAESPEPLAELVGVKEYYLEQKRKEIDSSVMTAKVEAAHREEERIMADREEESRLRREAMSARMERRVIPVDEENEEFSWPNPETGYVSRVILPKDPEESLKQWIALLGRIESEDATESGGANQEFRRVLALVGDLIDDQNVDKYSWKQREMGRRMMLEWEARKNILEAHGTYRDSVDHTGLQKAQDQIRGKTLNTLFESDEFVYCLDYLEHHAKEYWGSTPEERSEMKEKMQIDLILGDGTRENPGFGTEKEKAAVLAYQRAGNVSERIARLRATAGKWEDIPEMGELAELQRAYKNALFKHSWAGMAEKLWKVSLRAAMHADLKVDTEADGTAKKDYKGRPKLTWDMKGVHSGDIAARKLLKLKRWAKTQASAVRPIDQLLTGLDIEATDFFSKQVLENSAFTAEEKKVLKTKKKADDRKYDDKEAGEEGFMINFKKIQQKMRDSNPKGRFNFSNLTDRSSDFVMRAHAYRNVFKPGELVKALTDGEDSLISNPNKDNLYKLNNLFSYLEDKKWGVKTRVLKNWINYARNERNAETGKPKYTDLDIVSFVNEFAGLTDEKIAPFIQKGERIQVLRDTMGWFDPDRTLRNRLGRTVAGNFILGVILGILSRIGKGMSPRR